jgi:hypothetical protein
MSMAYLHVGMYKTKSKYFLSQKIDIDKRSLPPGVDALQR